MVYFAMSCNVVLCCVLWVWRVGDAVAALGGCKRSHDSGPRAFLPSRGPRALKLRYDFPPLLVPTNDTILNFSLRKAILGVSGCWKSNIFWHLAPTTVGPKADTHLGGLKGPLQLIVALGPAYEKTATGGGGFHTLNKPFMFLPRVTSY